MRYAADEVCGMSSPEQSDLRVLLDALREEETGVTTPPRVEAALMEAWDAQHVASTVVAREHPPRQDASRIRGFLAVAATMVLAAGLTTLGGLLREKSVRPFAAETGSATTEILIGEPILEGEAVRLVRMRLPVTVLHRLGIRSTAHSSDMDVEVVIGEDSVARAVRIDNPPTSSSR